MIDHIDGYENVTSCISFFLVHFIFVWISIDAAIKVPSFNTEGEIICFWGQIKIWLQRCLHNFQMINRYNMHIESQFDCRDGFQRTIHRMIESNFFEWTN